VVVIEAWPSVAWTKWIGAPRSRAWEAWAWRSQCGETARSMMSELHLNLSRVMDAEHKALVRKRKGAVA